MTTSNRVFGTASAFCSSNGLATGGVETNGLSVISRHLQGLFAEGGARTVTSSPRLTISTGLRRPTRTIEPAAIAPRPTAPTPAVTGTPAQGLVDGIYERTNLTLEEIAALLGTSRRTVHNWRAGEAISGQNERKLTQLSQTLERMDLGSAELTRRRLLDHAEGSIRLFDLLAEGRFEAAIAITDGSSGTPQRSGETVSASLAARLSPITPIEPLSMGTPSQHRLRRRRRG